MASKKISQLPSGSANVPLSGQTAVVYSGITHQQTLSSLRQNLVDSGSHFFSGSQYINGNLVVTGSITAQEFIISSSVSHITVQTVSGSSNFGDTLSDAHNFTGSVKITGSLNVNGKTSLTGSVMIGSGSFETDNPEILHVANSGSFNVVHLQANNQYYAQLNLKNTNSGNNASGDIVITANNGNESIHYVDLGINSSTYTGGMVGLENDAYLLNVGKDLYIGTVGGAGHPSNLKLFAQNLWENPQITISGSKQIAFNTGSVSSGYTYEFSGSLNLLHDININGATHLGSTVENILPINNPTTEFTHNFINGSIAYVSEATSDFTINLTNVPSNNNTAIGLTVILEQGLTAYKITEIKINSSPISISWYGGSQPSGTTNSTDIFAFSLIKINNAWMVLGQKTTF
jgi:hypothetical protein